MGMTGCGISLNLLSCVANLRRALLEESPACKKLILDDGGCDNTFTFFEAACLRKYIRLICGNVINLGRNATVSHTLVLFVLGK